MTSRANIDIGALRDELAGWLGEQPTFRRFCREPVVGGAEGDDPRWAQLRTAAHAAHLFPADLLPGARSVVAWFQPFQSWLAKENRGGESAPAIEACLARRGEKCRRCIDACPIGALGGETGSYLVRLEGGA